MPNYNFNIGIDVDGTLTKEVIGKEMTSLAPSIIRRAMLDCSPKNGIDILFENSHNHYIITGRMESFRDVTIEWLDMYGIPYKELIMFPNDFYINGHSLPKYIKLKIDIHIKKDVWIALDDNDEVIKSFNNSGISACQVTDNFRDAFEKVLDMEKDKKDNKENIE